jgi:hypothetical protein
MLLGLVASMGFELPSGSDLTRWVDSTKCWVDATMADRSGRCVEAPQPDVSPTDCLQAKESCHAPIVVEQPKSSEDKAFEAASNAMAADFAADLLAQTSEPKTLDTQTSIVEVLEVPAVGLPAGEELATQVVVEEKVEVVAEVVEGPVVTVEVTEVMQERLDRISNAVRLTREAAQAWAEVIQDSVDETSPTH